MHNAHTYLYERRDSVKKEIVIFAFTTLLTQLPAPK